jgi:ribonuclease R
MARAGRDVPFPSREEILRYIRENPDQASRREIARAFGIKGDARRELKELLRELIDEGTLEKGHGQRVADPTRLPNVTALEIAEIDVDGELWCRPIQWRSEAEPPRVLLVPDRRRTGAPALGPGDRVLARLRETEEGIYEARVMRVIGRGPDRVVGTFALVGGQGRIHPADRTGRDLWVAGPDSAGAKPGDVVHAEVLPARRLGLQQGKVIERLGDSKDPRALSLIAIYAHDLPTQFKPESLRQAEEATLPALGKRTDLRRIPLVTIDPEDARDFDDAVWAEPDSDPANPGGWRLMVAIADVAHYVRPGTALDADALKRGNSAYFPDRVIPMLPHALSSGMCSLKPDEDRACMAVEVWIDADGNKKRHRFLRGLMRSARRFTYAEAQEIHEHGGERDTVRQDVVEPLYAAHEALSRSRHKRGPLELNLPERVVRLSPDGDIVSVTPRAALPSHRLIEDFMILANVCAAETLEEKHVSCMYRIHDEPDREKLAALRDFLKSISINLAPGQVLKAKTFNTILAKASGSPLEHLIHQVVLRAQAQAVYSPENIGHFGLGLPRYAHFTSPIRRYADLLVHRALITACKLGTDGLAREADSDWRALGERISHAERRAMAAERDAVDRFTALYLSSKVGTLFKGRITGVSRFGLFVTLDESGADGLVPMRSLGTEYFRHDEDRHALVGEKSGETWHLGDAVTVKLMEADPIGGRLRLDIVSEALSRQSPAGRQRPRRPAPRGRRQGRR